MKKVDEVDKQRKEGKGLFGIVDILVKIILLIMISLLSRFRIYTPPPPTPTPLPPLEISVDDQFTIEDITAFEFIPLNININVGDNFYIDDSISYTFVGNEISINVTDVFYLDDTPSTSLQYIPVNISVTDSFTIEDNTSMQLGTNVVNVSVEDFFDLEDSVSTSFQYVPINISVQDAFYLDDTPSISLQTNWLVGWSYRKSHVINPSSGAGTNYQVKITVHYGSGTDSGADVYLGGKCRTDFGDIRFTCSDKVTLIDYWMENKVDGDYATFWVEVPDNLDSNSATIYVYYGNSSATTTSNGNNTFILFDDFIGSSIDTTKWSVTSGSVSVSNGYLTMTGSSVYNTVISKATIDNSANFEIAVKGYVSASNNGWRIYALFQDTSNEYEYQLRDYYYSNFSGLVKLRVVSGGTGTDITTGISPTRDTATHTWKIQKYGSSWTLYWDSITVSGTNTPPTGTRYLTGFMTEINFAGTTYIDRIYVRKFTSPEPSHGSWGSEESR